MSGYRSPADVLDQEARTALTVAHGRLQLIRRRADGGDVDCARLLEGLDDACLAIRRAVACLDAMASRTGGFPPSGYRHTDITRAAD